jgi:hypothetical protein
LTAGTIKIYPTAADLAADTNVIATYKIAATYDSSFNLTEYEVTKL